MSDQSELLDLITVRADVFGGKPIIRDMRIAVEHVMGMLAAGDTPRGAPAGVPDARTRGHPGLPAIRASFGETAGSINRRATVIR